MSSVVASQDAQGPTSAESPRPTATDGPDGGEAPKFHAYFLFHATPEQLQQVAERLHSHKEEDLEDFTIKVHQWENNERDATEADILLLAREKNCAILIDRRAADPSDGMILIIEWSWEEDCIQMRARLPASVVMGAACNLDICNMELIDFVNGSFGGVLEYDRTYHGPVDTSHL